MQKTTYYIKVPEYELPAEVEAESLNQAIEIFLREYGEYEEFEALTESQYRRKYGNDQM